jgi:hypothetical protein
MLPTATSDIAATYRICSFFTKEASARGKTYTRQFLFATPFKAV